MLTLDQFSESVLFQCDRCRLVGELITEIIEEEGSYYCWRCLSINKQLEMKKLKPHKKLPA
ncbi:MAG TPA: hypothetical protein VK791_05605 [bacterium]|jgi:hypothetical protein|nr:hypothetical protein [bacterium]